MPVVKGGVWTNSEDEILKVSVSKYGLNQWARVSSLLPRKTAKQCKARWNEWLDPSIKKTEWSKEEDEKLLHLAKLMPTQWRTIAPIVGRTANQCLERYQKLLDDAEQREASELGLAGPEGGESQAPTADDVRRLRPGEVDPDPETKPARPDTIDLDEDEKEMLSEARARLANTQGKKAKRKARERQQEEARRVANLQKRRELKTAGINIKVVTRKKGQMDYNADIPFERKAAPGFYDTTEELTQNERERAAFDPRKQQLAANKRKGDQDEGSDRKRRKEDGEGPSQAAMKAAQAQRLREKEQSSKRRALNLPAPQISEGEYEQIVKMGKAGENASTMARSSDNDATRGLVSDYSALNTGAPIRTPMAPPQEDRVMNEIKNIRSLTETQSALLGGENTPLHQGSESTGFDGIAPRKQTVSTPNPMATPMRPGMNGAGVGQTPRQGQTPFRTPRDTFALNANDDMSLVSATPADMKMRDMAIRHQLKQGLASLPKPKDTEWELELPEELAESTAADDVVEEDAGERDRRERERLEVLEALERKRRTQVMQRGLPRPAEVDLARLLKQALTVPDPAQRLVLEETARLMAHDAAKFRLPGASAPTKPVTIERFDDDSLAHARALIQEEMGPRPNLEQLQPIFAKRESNKLGLCCYDSDDELDVQIADMKRTFEDVQESIMSQAEAGAKLEKKLTLHLGGYQQRNKTLRQKMLDASDELEKARNAVRAFDVLATSEDITIRRKLESLREEVSHITKREREAQEEYRKVKAGLETVTAV